MTKTKNREKKNEKKKELFQCTESCVVCDVHVLI